MYDKVAQRSDKAHELAIMCRKIPHRGARHYNQHTVLQDITVCAKVPEGATTHSKVPQIVTT